MASLMGANRGEGWSNGYRYLVSPTQGQVPYLQLPINDGSGTDNGSMTIQDYPAVSFAGVSDTGAMTGSYTHNQVASLPSQVLPHKMDGAMTHHDYYPAFTEVQSTVYGYGNLENYGTTNVGKAVAMSLSSMENCNTMVQVNDAQVADQSGMCQGAVVHGHQMAVNNCNGEYLFSDLLGSENELPMLDVCKQNEGSNYYKMQTISVKDNEDSRNESLIGTEFPQLAADNIYINIDNARKEECQTDSYNVSHSSVQKKYKFYGKGRPYELEEVKDNASCEDYQSSAPYIAESHYQRTIASTSESPLPQYQYPTEMNLLNRTVAYGNVPETILPTREIATNFQYPSSSGYHYPSACQDDTTSEDSDSRTGSCKSDDRVSKDEKRAKELKIPLTTYEIISLPIDEFNEKLSKFELTDPQLSLIRDIRRRGKNKVAAQNCRKRKLDQIYSLQNEVQSLHIEKARLQTQQEALFKRRLQMNEKYIYMYQLLNNFNNKSDSIPDANVQQFNV